MGRSSRVRPTSHRNASRCGTGLFGLFVLIALLLTFVLPDTTTFAASDAAPEEVTIGKGARPAARADGAQKQQGRTADDTAKKASGETDSPDYVWSANRNESRITLRGAVPSEEDRQTALGMVKARFPDLTVEEKVEVVQTGLPREQWLAAVSFGLQQLAQMTKGKVRLTDGGLTVTGQALNAEEYGKIKKALAGTLPAGLTLKADGVRPPVADPFVFQADLGPNALSLAGSVPSENARKTVRDLSRQLFARPGLDDRLEVASGAPKNWDEAVAAALRALSRLETGKVALTGVSVSIEGVAPDQGTAVAVAYQLRRDLPERFSTSESIKWKEADAPLNFAPQAVPSPGLAATVVPRIKPIPEDSRRWQSGALPPLIPLRTER